MSARRFICGLARGPVGGRAGRRGLAVTLTALVKDANGISAKTTVSATRSGARGALKPAVLGGLTARSLAD